MAVFALLSVMAYSGLSSVLRAGKQTEQATDELGKIQMAFLLLEKDLLKSLSRPIRDEFGKTGKLEAAFVGDESRIEFSSVSGISSLSSDATRSGLQRIEYFVDGGDFKKRVWNVMDRYHGTAPYYEISLLSDVASFKFQFAHDEGYVTFWPRDESLDSLPKALEVQMELERWGPVSRLFQVSSQ